MARRPTGKRYARALFDLAVDNNSIDEWADALLDIGAVLDEVNSSRTDSLFDLSLPKQKAIFLPVVNDLHQILQNLIALLIARSSLALLPGIAGEFKDLADKYYGRVRGIVYTAVDLEPPALDRLKKILEQSFGKSILLENKVDDSIVGGILVQIGDTVLDGTTASRLSSLRSSLMGNAAR